MTISKAVFSLARTGLVLIFAGMIFVVLGPFQNAERGLGLGDKEAHVLACFTLTLLAQLSAPRAKRWLIALLILGVGAGIEIIQAFVGRSLSLSDWLADAVGVGLATLPSLGETLRTEWRKAAGRDAA